MLPVPWGFWQSSHIMLSSEAKLERSSIFLLLLGKRFKTTLLKTSRKEYNWQISTFNYDENCCSCWWHQNTFWNVMTILKKQGAPINGVAESIKKGNLHHHLTNRHWNTFFFQRGNVIEFYFDPWAILTEDEILYTSHTDCGGDYRASFLQ